MDKKELENIINDFDKKTDIKWFTKDFWCRKEELLKENDLKIDGINHKDMLKVNSKDEYIVLRVNFIDWKHNNIEYLKWKLTKVRFNKEEKISNF